MTNEEAREQAINYLKSSGMSDEQINTVIDAFTCDDCISREAVMKCFKKWQPYMATRLWDYEQELKDLPSVTPTISDVENNYDIGYNCGYADAMCDISEGE